MLSDSPLVSIVIPTFSRPNAAAEAIRTVRSQSYPHWEVIIVDDNPPESEARRETRDLVSPLADDQIHYIEHDQNRGACAARNTGVKHSRGSLIAFLDDDDLWAPSKLERQVGAMLSDESLCLCLCSISEAYRGGHRIVRFDPGNHSYHDYFLNRGSGVTCSAIMVNRLVYERVGGFDEDLESYQDLDLILRMLPLGNANSIEEPLVTYQLADSGISKNHGKKVRGIDRLLIKFDAQFETSGRDGRTHFLEDRADHLLLMGSYAPAASQYFDLVRSESKKLRYAIKGLIAVLHLGLVFRIVLRAKALAKHYR